MPPGFNEPDNLTRGSGWKLKPAGGFDKLTLRQICQETENHTHQKAFTELKIAPDKRVLLLHNDSSSIIIKDQRYLNLAYSLQATFRHLLGGKDSTTYAKREYLNTITAQERGVPVGRMLGYGCRLQKWLVRQEILLTESCQPEGKPLIDILREDAKNQRPIEKTLQRAFLLISRMLKTGYVHLDLHSDNILFSSSGSDQDIIIDHEFGSIFSPEKLQAVAAFVFGYLFRCQVREHIPLQSYRALVEDAAQIVIGPHAQLDTVFFKQFEYAATIRVPKRERKTYLRL